MLDKYIYIFIYLFIYIYILYHIYIYPGNEHISPNYQIGTFESMIFPKNFLRCHGLFFLGMGRVIPPEQLGIRKFHGYINPYGSGLMSLSPIIWK